MPVACYNVSSLNLQDQVTQRSVVISALAQPACIHVSLCSSQGSLHSTVHPTLCLFPVGWGSLSMANNQSDSDSESSSDYETHKETRDTCRRQEPCLGTHKKKMKYNQKFSDLWLLNPMFKPCIKKEVSQRKVCSLLWPLQCVFIVCKDCSCSSWAK